MRCWNCNQEIPDDATVCVFCEATVEEEPSEEEKEAVLEMLEQMSPETLDELRAAFAQSKSAEDFVNRIFVGSCPECGSEETGDCENDSEIGELLVGRCYHCGHLWCTECGRSLTKESPECECWMDEDDEEESDE